MIEVTKEMLAAGESAWAECKSISLLDVLVLYYRAMRALEPKPRSEEHNPSYWTQVRERARQERTGLDTMRRLTTVEDETERAHNRLHSIKVEVLMLRDRVAALEAAIARS